MEESPDPKASGLTLLGRAQRALPASPGEAELETFPNGNPDRRYRIQLDCPEFTSLCPVTGQPDFAHLEIGYVPGTRCVETKSLKFYLAAFRNHPAFNEEVVNRILDDLVAACEPHRMTVTGRFRSRGGISLTVTAEYPDPDSENAGPAGK